jgi:hypothetical protein
MTTRIELPGNHWAELRDPMDVTERDLRPLKEAFLGLSEQRKGPTPGVGEVAVTGAVQLGAPPVAVANRTPVGEQLDQIEAFEHEAMAFFVVAWDFEADPTPDALWDIPIPVKNALDKATAPLLQEMFPGLKDDDGRPTTP